MRTSTWRALAAITAVSGVGLSACSSSSTNSGSASTTQAPSTSSVPNSTQSSQTGPPSATVALSETGSTLLYPLFQQWAPAYHTKYSNITVTPQGTGSGTGISQASQGAADIGASDAFLPPATLAKGMINIPLAISAQQINYNIPGIAASTHLKLNGTILADIYTGKTLYWDDSSIKAANPGVHLPHLKIVPLHRSDGSGDTFIFTTYLSDSAPSIWTLGFNTSVSWPSVPGALAENGNGGMVTAAAATPGSIAYIGISFLSQTTAKGLGEAQLRNAAGNYLLPTPATVKNEAAGFITKTPTNEAISLVYGPASNGYPIINYEYAIVKPSQSSATTAQAIRAFLTWAIDPNNGSAPSFLNAVNFQPLPTRIVKLSQAQIAKIQ